jgi:hypothetical protein
MRRFSKWLGEAALMNDTEVDDDLTDMCDGCGRTILGNDDIVAVEAMRRRQGQLIEWHIVLCSACHWRPEYSARLSLVVREVSQSTA